MHCPQSDPSADLARAVEAYRASGRVEELLGRLDALAREADPEALAHAAEPYREVPEIIGPLYESIVERRPDDAHALVTLANAYWLSGRGGQVVGMLASRALAADPAHRGAWHLWALSEEQPRARTERWRQVVARFPQDELAKALLADNAASLAGAEHDPMALALAIETYESLLATATRVEQREALRSAITTLKGWRF